MFHMTHLLVYLSHVPPWVVCIHDRGGVSGQPLVEFEERFGEEEACRAYLARVRWPEGYRCPACGHPVGWVPIFDTTSSAPGVAGKLFLTAGTIKDGTRKPLHLWFLAILGAAHREPKGVPRGCSVFQRLRRAMVRSGRERLTGVVEVDDPYLGGGELGVSGRESVTKARLVVAVELSGEKICRVRLRHVPIAGRPGT